MGKNAIITIVAKKTVEYKDLKKKIRVFIENKN